MGAFQAVSVEDDREQPTAGKVSLLVNLRNPKPVILPWKLALYTPATRPYRPARHRIATRSRKKRIWQLKTQAKEWSSRSVPAF